MASRMDRYYKSELVSRERSSKNKMLYQEIDDLDSYSNIEGVANIESSNEIDITKVREMLKNRDEYKKQSRYNSLLDKDSSKEDTKFDDTRTYDINSVLSKVRDNSSDEKYRSLDNDQYEALKNVKKKHDKFDIEKEENELKELIHTLYASKTQIQSKLNDVTANSDGDVGLLDELKSDTMVGDAASIKSILEEEKNTIPEEKDEIDNSFYTKSFGFTSSDFEELKDMNHKIKKGNKYIIILLVILILLVAVISGIFFLPRFFNFNF